MDGDQAGIATAAGHDAPTAPALIPEGAYEIRTVRVERSRQWGRTIVYVHCEILGGPHDGTKLFWTATALPPARKRIPLSSKLMRAWIMTTARRPAPGEHPSEGMLVHKRFRVSVETVTRDSRGHPLPAAARYSIVRDLLERLA